MTDDKKESTEDLQAKIDELEDEYNKMVGKKEKKSEAAVPKQVTPKEGKKSENIASETPQDRFRKIVKDQGYTIGLENMTSVFFEGNTDEPTWLDEVLKLSHIPAKSRELIITAFYGRTLSDLGITVDAGVKKKDVEKKDDIKKADDDLLDIDKLSQDELKNSIKNEKTLLALAQMKKMRKDLEGDKSKEVQQQSYQMRQVIRPVLKDGQIMRDSSGTVITETVVEPINMNQQGGLGNDIMNMLAMKAIAPPVQQQAPVVDQTLVEYIKKLDQKIENMENSRLIQAKEDEIKRMNDKLERKEEEYKKDMERKEKEFSDRLDKLNSERVRDLTELKERFAETISHKKELDDVIGQISSAHKKEIDGMKQKLEHAQTNIERTIVAKSTDTVDKLTGKVGDIAESVIKPMADVMKDHYKTVIDQTRVNAGLPSLRDTLPKVNEGELERFAMGE